MISQNLNQKMLQKLSPQQIQLMKLLQVPTATLDQRIKEELEVNPALEEGEETDEFEELDEGVEEPLEGEEEYEEEPVELDEYLDEYMEDDPSSYQMNGESPASDEEEKTIPIAMGNSFQEFLERQVGMLDLADERMETIAMQIIGSIDDDGYLRRDSEAIIDDLMFSQNVVASEEEVEGLLRQIQQFDPPGVGARNLQECLSIQLRQILEREDLSMEQEEDVRLAKKIIDGYFDQFSKKHFQKLERQLNISEDELRGAMEQILKLNPKPGSGFSGGGSGQETQYVIPDFFIENRDGELELRLNSRNAPELRINDQYLDMLKSFKATTKGRRALPKEKEAVLFIKQKIDSAKWFIDAIRQRQNTMFHTMYAILQYQYDYFLTGDPQKLKPMILKDIADVTALDISTVSRVVNSKFVQTEFGTKRLKEFFSESLQTNEGEEVSTLEVKKILEEVIAGEDKRKPLSDEKLKNILQEKGYNIARRTVAKYREQLNLPVARLRKEL